MASFHVYEELLDKTTKGLEFYARLVINNLTSEIGIEYPFLNHVMKNLVYLSKANIFYEFDLRGHIRGYLVDLKKK